MNSSDTTAGFAATAPADSRLVTARRVFLAALSINSLLTVLCALSYFTGFGSSLVGSVSLDGQTALRIGSNILIISVLWGFIWLGIKSLLLAKVAGFTRAERRAAFGSRMR